jgi:hypothetical protein
MREKDWLASVDIHSSLRLVRGEAVGFLAFVGLRKQPQVRAGERRMRLFGCACCRRIERLIEDKRFLHGVEAVEQLADGRRQRNELESVFAAVEQVYQETCVPWNPSSYSFAAAAIRTLVEWQPEETEYGTIAPENRTVNMASVAVGLEDRLPPARMNNLAESQEHQAQCHLLRDIFGNPFRPVTLNPSWLTSTVVSLATGIYDEKAFDRMPILADALQDARCDNEDILNHCRQDGEHVKGCFVVDLILSHN